MNEGETHRYLMGNCEHSTLGHSLTNQMLFLMIVDWFKAVSSDKPRPKIAWEWGMKDDMLWATLNVTSSLKPTKVRVRYTESQADHIFADIHRRDFRWTVPNETWVLPGEWESDKFQISEKATNEAIIRPVIVYKIRPQRLSDSSFYYETNIPSQGFKQIVN